MTHCCLKYGFYSESSYFRNSISETFAFFRRLTITIFRRTGFDDFSKQCQQRLSAMVRAEGINIDRLAIGMLLLHEPNQFLAKFGFTRSPTTIDNHRRKING